MASVAENKKTILEFFRRAEVGEDILAMIDDDVVYWVPGTWKLAGTYTKAELGPLFGTVFSMLATLPKFTIHNITAEDDRVAVDASSSASFKDGRAFGNTYHFLFRLRNGKLIEVKEYLDTHYMANLLNADPEIAG